MDIDTPPSSALASNAQNGIMIEDKPPPSSVTVQSNPVSSEPTSNPQNVRMDSSDSAKKNKDGYWKLKEAASKVEHQITPSPQASSSKLPEFDQRNSNDSHDAVPQLSNTANTIDHQQDIIMTPETSTIPLLDDNAPPLSTSSLPTSTPMQPSWSQPKKRGRRKQSPPPLMTTKGISLVFRMPPGSSNQNITQNHQIDSSNIASGSGSGHAIGDGVVDGNTSRASTPDSNVDISSRKKRKSESNLSSSRPTRNRPSPSNTPLSGSPGPSIPNTHALSIFAPPPPTDQLPQALQSSTTPSVLQPYDTTATTSASTPTGTRNIVDADALRKEAAVGFESRLRLRNAGGALTASNIQRRDGGERTGVSASGKDVRVGGTARTAEKANQPNNTSNNNNGNNTSSSTGNKKKGKGKADVDIPNQDFCSACRGIGRFLCCDGCPRSFHFMCLEPPLRIDELPDEDAWYCKKCKAERLKESGENASPGKEKELKPIPMVFKQLSKKVDAENPCQFRLPQPIRTYFAGVGTASKGEYVDADEARTKFDRKGFQEERDPLRFRDGKNKHISCYHCGGTSLPNHSLTTDPESTWRQIVSCDYCTLSWHLDCLDPPLSSMPNSQRKWMCPNHAEQALPHKRTLRSNLETIDIESRNQPNNGNITIIPEPETPTLKGPALDYEDLIINRKKFRVPEKIIRLDFWEKVKNQNNVVKSDTIPEINPSQDDIEAANLVLSLLGSEAQAQYQVPTAAAPLPTSPPKVQETSASDEQFHPKIVSKSEKSTVHQNHHTPSKPLAVQGISHTPDGRRSTRNSLSGSRRNSSSLSTPSPNNKNANKPQSTNSNASTGTGAGTKTRIVLRMPPTNTTSTPK
ncbi:uncharacterized protein L201_005527 [Kwoniella dendrophila CBS 6074]|uniref:PHD-type domain-containing protein n=1 Tax=Kwoniella dendrophila CBS 6074 TaxID=1295534 RepID=A0AAX4JZC3_9TREE